MTERKIKVSRPRKPGTQLLTIRRCQVFGLWGLAGGATDDYYITKGIPFSFTLGKFYIFTCFYPNVNK